MIQHLLFTAVLALSCSSVALAHATMDSSPTAASQTSTTQSGPTLRKAKPRADGFTALPNKKGGSSVAVAYRIEGTPAVGAPLTIRITMSSHGNANIKLRADEGLKLDPPQQSLQSPAGKSAEHSVTVVPLTEGRHYLHLISSAHGRSSASAIAVQVGKATVQSKPAGRVQTLPSGERIISVPASQ